MASTLKLEIVTPEAKIFSDDVEMVTLPGVEGELGIYPMHIPLMTQIKAGELAFQQHGQNTYMAVGEGFVEITGDRVAILTDMAIDADQIDETKTEAACRQAETRLSEQITEEEAAAANAAIMRSMAQLHVKRRKR